MVYVPATLSVIVSIWMETLFYGINCAVFFLCIYDLAFSPRYSRKATKHFLLSLSTILFAAATAHMGVNFSRLIKGYVDPPDKAASLKFLVDLTEPTNVAKQFLVVFVNLLSDVLIIWRIYMVWERNLRVCIFNALVSVAVFVAGVVMATYQSQVRPGQTVFIRRISRWATAQLSLALVMNVSATMFIAVRIWWVTRPIRAYDPDRMRPYWRIIVIVVESASFAAFGQTIVLAFYAADFPGVYFVADSVTQIVAMNPLLIIAFVGRTRRQDRRVSSSYNPTGRILTRPVYAGPADSTTGSFDAHKDKPIRLSLLNPSNPTSSDPNTEYSSNTLSPPSIVNGKTNATST